MVFALFAAFLLGYFALNTRRLINEQIVTTVDAEITALTEQYNQGGIRRLVVVVDVRSRRPGSSLYLVTTPTGEGLAGNVGSLEPGILDQTGWVETAYRRLEEPESAEHNALVRVIAACPAASGSWSAATSTSASGCSTSSSPPGAGRSRSWSCSGRRRHLREPARAQSRRRDDRDRPDHHGGRPASGGSR